MSNEVEQQRRISRILDKAVALFEGDVEAARKWLATPRAALQGHSPADAAATERGAREVEQLIGQLEYGVFP